MGKAEREKVEEQMFVCCRDVGWDGCQVPPSFFPHSLMVSLSSALDRKNRGAIEKVLLFKKKLSG